jgi:hypothetical protein
MSDYKPDFGYRHRFGRPRSVQHSKKAYVRNTTELQELAAERSRSRRVAEEATKLVLSSQGFATFRQCIGMVAWICRKAGGVKSSDVAVAMKVAPITVPRNYKRHCGRISIEHGLLDVSNEYLEKTLEAAGALKTAKVAWFGGHATIDGDEEEDCDEAV